MVSNTQQQRLLGLYQNCMKIGHEMEMNSGIQLEMILYKELVPVHHTGKGCAD